MEETKVVNPNWQCGNCRGVFVSSLWGGTDDPHHIVCPNCGVVNCSADEHEHSEEEGIVHDRDIEFPFPTRELDELSRLKKEKSELEKKEKPLLCFCGLWHQHQYQC